MDTNMAWLRFFLRHCPLEENSLSIGRIKMVASEASVVQMTEFAEQVVCFVT